MSCTGRPSSVEGKGKRRKSYLIAFLDDATRVVPYAAFACPRTPPRSCRCSSRPCCAADCPRDLYVDNGANYRSHHLALVCAKLGVALIHARPYQPQGKGKLERWFRTVRAQLIPSLASASSTPPASRRSTGACGPTSRASTTTPRTARLECRDSARALGAARPSGRPLPRAQPRPRRAVPVRGHSPRAARPHRVLVNGVVYEVDAALIGEKVTLRYDPAAPPGRPDRGLARGTGD